MYMLRVWYMYRWTLSSIGKKHHLRALQLRMQMCDATHHMINGM